MVAFRGDNQGKGNADVSCPKCQKQFKSSAKQQKHSLKCNTMPLKMNRPLKPAEQMNLRQECQICGECLKCSESLNLHTQCHVTPLAGMLKCGMNRCSFLVTSAEELKQHREEHVCSGPDESSTAKESSCFSSIPYSCIFCGQSIDNFPHYSSHMEQHYCTFLPASAEHKLYYCEVLDCMYSGRKLSSLQAHQNRVHIFDLFTCCLCGQRLDGPVSFGNHLRRHDMQDEGDVYYCPHLDCKQTFLHSESLQVHAEGHEGVRRFQCQECGEWTLNKQHLRRHIKREHTCSQRY